MPVPVPVPAKELVVVEVVVDVKSLINCLCSAKLKISMTKTEFLLCTFCSLCDYFEIASRDLPNKIQTRL